MNYFEPEQTAERYAKGRPNFHYNTIQRIKAILSPEHKVATALDIACGTGLSTQALLEIAHEVTGTDTSASMLKQTVKHDRIRYLQASAAEQPFDDGTFDLITVCSGVHWFDIDTFLQEAHRLLKPDSWLILYDNFFLSKMKGIPAFDNWFADVYQKKFPSPARNNCYDWSKEHLRHKGFNMANEEAFENEVIFTKDQLKLYFTTQSNISNAITNGGNYKEIEQWLDHALTPFFSEAEDKRILFYGNTVQYLQRLS